MLLTIIGSTLAHATPAGEKLAKNYLKDLLNKDYENLYKYINVEQFNADSGLTITEYLNKKVNDKKLSISEKNEFESNLFEQGLSKKDLDESTVKDLLTYFFVEMYRINSDSFGGKTLGEIELLSVTKDTGKKEHYLFKVKQVLVDEENPNFKRKFTSTELVSVKYVGESPVILHPNKVLLYVDLLAKGLVDLGD